MGKSGILHHKFSKKSSCQMLCKNLLVKYQNWLKIEIFGYFIHSILEMFLGSINKEPKRGEVQISIWEDQNKIVRGC